MRTPFAVDFLHSQARARDGLSSRPTPHCRIQVLKTWNCSQVSCAPEPGPGRQAAIWRPTSAQHGPKTILAGVPKTSVLEVQIYIFVVYISSHFRTLFLVPSRALPLSKIRSQGGVFSGPLANWPRAFWQAKTCNCSQIYCPTVSEIDLKAGSLEGHLSWGS